MAQSYSSINWKRTTVTIYIRAHRVCESEAEDCCRPPHLESLEVSTAVFRKAAENIVEVVMGVMTNVK